MPFPNPETQFRPGQSGNPGGRPKSAGLVDRLRKALDQELTDRRTGKPTGRTVADVLVDVMVKQALAGDFRFVNLVLERLEGKVPDRVVTTQEQDLTTLADFLHGRTGDDAAEQ